MSETIERFDVRGDRERIVVPFDEGHYVRYTDHLETLAMYVPFTDHVAALAAAEQLALDERAEGMRLRARVAQLAKLAKFGAEVLLGWRAGPGYDIDGAWIEATAEECGVVECVTRSLSCGQDCTCADHYRRVGDREWECLQIMDRDAVVRIARGEG